MNLMTKDGPVGENRWDQKTKLLVQSQSSGLFSYKMTHIHHQKFEKQRERKSLQLNMLERSITNM